MNAPSDNTDKVIETLDTFIALKKNTQCMDIKKPAKNNFKNNIADIFPKGNNTEKISKQIVAINILNQTNSTESIEISEPIIAVKPNINTIK